MNSFEELVHARQSCRKYAKKEVEQDKLEKLIEITHLSPSACNSQPWKFIVVSGKKAEKVRPCLQKDGRNTFTDNCPAFTIVVEEKAKLLPAIAAVMPSQTFSQLDLGIAIAHYTLAAADMGLSTCVIGWLDEDKLNAILDIKDDEKIRIVIATGYADESDKFKNKEP